MRHDPVHRADQLIGSRVEVALEVLDDRRGDDRNLAQINGARRAVDRDHVALADDQLAVLSLSAELAGADIDLELVGAAHAGLAHAAGDHGRMTGLAAPRSEEHTSELQSLRHLVCRLLLEKKKKKKKTD